MSARRCSAAAALATALWCSSAVAAVLWCSSVRADVFEPIALVSQGQLGSSAQPQQAEYAHDTAISGDGRYVVFDGSIGGVGGVWRRDLQTGALQQVAGGDAELPSISANGRYVSFTTNEGASLAEITYALSGRPPAGSAVAKEAVNVYVRDMTLEPSASEAFALASAVNAPGQPVVPLQYQSSEPTRYGAAVAARSAISADGSEVAFVTTAVSDLAGPSTPALQVAVRYLDTHETKLVSRCYASCRQGVEPAVGAVEAEHQYGALYPGGSAAFGSPPPYGAYGVSPPPGASLSADGSTVSWMGEDIAQQAALLPGESRSAHYVEPLWRRIEPGSETATERVTGGSEPTNPACVASGEASLPSTPSAADPCQGPFVLEEQSKAAGVVNETGGETGDFVPRLSADGYTVAFVSQAPLVGLGENFGRSRDGQPSDLYVASMRAGPTRRQALTQLTELAGGEEAGSGDTAPIFDFEISPAGDQVAFVTRRIQFPLGSPAYVSPPEPEAGLNELFDADLADDTLTRVTHGFASAGEAGQHAHLPRPVGIDPYPEAGDGALSPSFSGDGDTIAFSSTAANLVYGDGNAPPASSSGSGALDGSDAFVVARHLFAPTPTPQSISPAPTLSLRPAWTLAVNAVSRSDGEVVLYVWPPGAGELRAGAQAQVPVRVVTARRAGGGRRGSHPRVASRPALAYRAVASAARNLTAGEEPVAVRLRLANRYAALARQPSGLSATVAVSFAAPGEPLLRERLQVVFVRARPPARGGHGARRRGEGRRR